MQIPKGPQGILLVYGSFVAISSILVLNGILSSSSEPASALFLGLSIPRLLFASGLLIASGIFTSITVRALRDQEWAERILEEWFGEGRFSKLTAWLTGISFGLAWIGCFLPLYRVGTLVNYWIRIRPVMIFILLASLATLAVIFIKRSRLGIQNPKISKTHYFILVLFSAAILALGIMLSSGFGVHASEDFWYGAGVPVLVTQMIAAIVGGILFFQIERKWNSKRLDVAVFLIIYTATAILWMREPLQESFMFPGPYPPNHVLYPFADSATFDTASQFALIGQGISNGKFSERSLYISFLVYLHSVFGQNYEQIAAAQSGIFAVLPALIYLIGKSLKTRWVGFAAALVAIIRGMNAITASNMIDLAGPKTLLTDFPTAIGMAIIVLLTCEWLKDPAQKRHYAFWIGGGIGFALMLRTNTLVLLLFIPLYAFLKFSADWKKWLTSSLFIFLATVAITLPWELRNQSRGGMIYGSYLVKFQNVIEQRYISPPEPGGFLPQPRRQELASVSFKSIQAILAPQQPAKITRDGKPCNTVICFAPNHFVHNILTSVLILPTSLSLDDLEHTVRDVFPYWRPDWDGSLPAPSLLFLVLNLLFIVTGISVAWNKHGLPGLAPLAIFMFYNLSNALARTSGGRYLVPMDWIISIYFLLGVFQLITSMAGAIGAKWELFSTPDGQDIPKPNFMTRNFLNPILILVILFGFGSLIPLSENLHNRHFQNFGFRKVLIEHKQAITNAGMSMNDINSFLEDQNAKLLVGRVLYPRFYPIDRGEILLYPYVAMGFPRLAFTLIGPSGERGIILPGDSPKYFPQGVDAIVLGCKEEKYIDALAVILLDNNGGVYTRSPKSDLGCPLKQPVCNSNRVCE